MQLATHLKHNLLNDLIVKGVRPWVITAALKCAATATKYYHNAPSVCLQKTTCKYWNDGLHILRVGTLNYRMEDCGFKSIFIYFSQQSSIIFEEISGCTFKIFSKTEITLEVVQF